MKEFKSFFKTVGGNEGSKCQYSTRLDTYGCGCSHDCKYCYAKSLLEFRGMWNPEEPSVANIKKIENKIKKYRDECLKNGKEIKPLRLGGMTDCFQPLEKSVRNTYQTIELLNRYRVPYLIVTKSAMIGDNEYLKVMDKRLAHIQVTVTTTDDELSKTYEKASVPSKRINAIGSLHEDGFDVAIRLSPYIRDYIDFEILKTVKCEKAIVEFLRVNHWIKKWFDIDYSDWALKEGGYEHLPLATKVKMLEELKMNTNFKEVSVCEDVTEHYEFWKETNPNRDDCCNLRNENSEFVLFLD